MIKYLILLLTFSLLCSNTQASIEKDGDTYEIDLLQLDNTLLERDQYIKVKEDRIIRLKRGLNESIAANNLLNLYDSIYQEYYTYKFDSAMHYVKQMDYVAQKYGNKHYQILSAIHKSVLLTTSGFFCESEDNLKCIPRNHIDSSLILPYYLACEWQYRQWGEYNDDDTFAPQYKLKELAYQDSIIEILEPNSREFHFWKGENLYRKQSYKAAEAAYNMALQASNIDERIFARCAFGLALINANLGDRLKYVHYMSQAAISDQVCPLKENLALQELALFLYQDNQEEASRSNRYLCYSMDDAQFYNNKLRLLEISKKIPTIFKSYEQQIIAKNKRLLIYMYCIIGLLLGILCLLYYIYRQMLQVKAQKASLVTINETLNHKNEALTEANLAREKYVSLFMNLCATYIDKLNKYQTMVKRKVKMNQIEDLVKSINTARLSETEAKEFYINFDSSFLYLYPDFVSDFNKLLRQGEEIIPKQGELLNTELRIYALIRLGIKDSNQIANLLFYSTQTIYNYRSLTKAKALDKDNFENQIIAL